MLKDLSTFLFTMIILGIIVLSTAYIFRHHLYVTDDPPPRDDSLLVKVISYLPILLYTFSIYNLYFIFDSSKSAHMLFIVWFTVTQEVFISMLLTLLGRENRAIIGCAIVYSMTAFYYTSKPQLALAHFLVGISKALCARIHSLVVCCTYSSIINIYVFLV
jgi:hypothetical protein